MKGYLDNVDILYLQRPKLFLLIEISYGNEIILKGLNTAEGQFHLVWSINEGDLWKLARIKNLERYV